MSRIYIKSTSVFLIIFTFGLLGLCWLFLNKKGLDHFGYRDSTTLTFSHPEVQCDLDDVFSVSLESFIRASLTMESEELRLSGLAVFSKLVNACQPLADVSKSKIQVNKIAVISLENEDVCPIQDLVVSAQNAGYSLVIYFSGSSLSLSDNRKQTDTRDVLLIPVLSASRDCLNSRRQKHIIDDSDLLKADRTNVGISTEMQNTAYLANMTRYLAKLYYWFLLGPIITLEWLRRTKKFCWMSGGQQVRHEVRATEDEGAVGETGLQSVTVGTLGNYDQETDHERSGREEQPLITDPRTYLTTMRHTRCLPIRRVTAFLGKIFYILAVCCGYVILIVAALPVGISSGGLCFFRFDELGTEEEISQETFWEKLVSWLSAYVLFLFLPLWWSPFQIFCFFLYSRFACKTTWTTPTKVSKLIRSDWFASNMYLFILGLVIPYCSFSYNFDLLWPLFIYFTAYNTVCTICNLLFIIILNKHKFVTSDIVAVFYFMLNSEGSLTNLKLTALRTVAIGFTLTLSLRSSMHIIRKLAKPQESLFEGLSEK